MRHVAAHPPGAGPVICVEFVAPPLLAPRGYALTPLLSVAADGSIALTNTHVRDDGTGADIPTEIVASVAADHPQRGRDGGGVSGAPHTQHHRAAAAAADPVVAAAVERETNPALVAVARAGGLQVYAVDSVEHKAALRASYAPHAERFMALAPAGAASVKSALVAWSAADTGVVCYCSRATAGKIVVFNAANSTVTRVLDAFLGGVPSGVPRCLSVVFKPGGGGDIVAVGGDKGVEFIELSSRWGCAL